MTWSDELTSVSTGSGRATDQYDPDGRRARRSRAVLVGRRWPTGGDATLIVWREVDDVVLSHEGAARSTVRLTPDQATALARLICDAADAPDRDRQR